MIKEQLAYWKVIFIFLALFILATSAIFIRFSAMNQEQQSIANLSVSIIEADVISNETDLTYKFVEMPKNRIDFNDILIYSDGIFITNSPELNTIKLFETTASGSMFPLLYNSSKALIIKPPEEDIVVGDIAVYNDPDGIYIMHRIVEMGYDESGVYYMTKGDNNPNIDPYLIRYNNLEGVVIAIIY